MAADELVKWSCIKGLVIHRDGHLFLAKVQLKKDSLIVRTLCNRLSIVGGLLLSKPVVR